MLLLPNIDFIVEPAEAVEAIKAAYFAEAKFLPRQALTVGDTWFAPMVGYLPGAGIAVKLVGIYPKATPRVKAVVIVFDKDMGTPLALINGTQLTAWRTAAASGVVAKTLGVNPGEVGIIGAGVQGEYHLRVFKALYPGAKYKIYNRDFKKAEELGKRYGAIPSSLGDVLKSDLIIAATASTSPVVRGAELKNGAVVISIGAPRPVRELDDDVKRRAGCMLVDNPHAVDETDDIGQNWVYVGDFLKGASCKFGEITVYKSVGNPLFDAAFANYVLEKAKKLGVAVEIKWD
ncbi:ornithine cyclodeaminase family protein [Pyrobaculum aerophilum]|uniref:Ornithine cyclodeaminase n=1 Tax=Pyrobaculum aerophilum TaxID=13773 RepID=A0A371R347_9CREN|nr:ornithine cyclodeaminase family protein [Pyrobaculum aerophilum]RFA98190.1 ornithine cyclodeaminase [Pyrobaculum aerophilum]